MVDPDRFMRVPGTCMRHFVECEVDVVDMTLAEYASNRKFLNGLLRAGGDIKGQQIQYGQFRLTPTNLRREIIEVL